MKGEGGTLVWEKDMYVIILQKFYLFFFFLSLFCKGDRVGL